MKQVKLRWANMSHYSSHLARPCEIYASSEMINNVSYYFPTASPSVPKLNIQLFVVPPHGQDDLGNLQSIFELAHLRESLSFLDTQCLYHVLTCGASQSVVTSFFANLALQRSYAPSDWGIHIT